MRIILLRLLPDPVPSNKSHIKHPECGQMFDMASVFENLSASWLFLSPETVTLHIKVQSSVQNAGT